MKKENIFKTAKKIHFIGIGGIGISALARMALLEGKEVSGSDRENSIITDELKKLGAEIYIGHNPSNIKDDVDFVTRTTAVPTDTPEVAEVIQKNIPLMTYPETLGMVSKDKFTIAVCGAHGKTTTTAMIAKVMTDAKLDPTVIVGSLMKDNKSASKGSNFIAGKSKYFVCEACEYKRAFLNYNPKITIITNIDKDHLDYYKDIEDIQSAFLEFLGNLPEDGVVIYDSENKNSAEVIEKARPLHPKIKFIDFSKTENNLKLKTPGDHNIKNAQASLALADILEIPHTEALKSLEDFFGTWRRFEYKGRTENGVIIYDDYAHHPTEIKATLKGAKEFFKDKKIWCVFQPHLFSRTKILIDDFAKSFKDADEVIVADIYAARENGDKEADAKTLAEKIKEYQPNTRYGGSFANIEKFLKKNASAGDVVITMGAGEAFKIGENLLKIKNFI